MSKILKLLTFPLLLVFFFQLVAIKTEAGIRRYELMFSTVAQEDGTYVGSFDQNNIMANDGDEITINIEIKGDDPYCCKVNFKFDKPQGKYLGIELSPGQSKSITFIADSFYSINANQVDGPILNTNPVEVVAPTPTPRLPETPKKISATAISSSRIDLTWQRSKNASAYELYRNDELVSLVSALFFSDSDLEANTPYVYKVRATDNTYYSEFSEQIEETTLTDEFSLNSEDDLIDQQIKQLEENQELIDENTLNTVPIDEDFSYVTVNGDSYSLDQIPLLQIEDEFIIYGRTVEDSEVEAKFSPSEYSTSATADQDGFWEILVNMEKLEIGENQYVISVLSDQYTRRNVSEPEIVNLKTIPIPGENIIDSTFLSTFFNSSEVNPLYLAIIGVVTLILILFLLFRLVLPRYRKKKDVKEGEKKGEEEQDKPSSFEVEKNVEQPTTEVPPATTPVEQPQPTVAPEPTPPPVTQPQPTTVAQPPVAPPPPPAGQPQPTTSANPPTEVPPSVTS